MLGIMASEAGPSNPPIESLQRKAAEKRQSFAAWFNLGVALRKAGRLDASIAAYRRVISIQAEYADAHMNLAMALLEEGRFEEGWPEHEWRWRCEDFSAPRRTFTQPQWRGQPLAGRTLFLHAEQGIGDTIQF